MLLMNHMPQHSREISQHIAGACAKVTPLWPLDSFVAVNPFVGLGGMKFLEANELIKRTRHTEILLPASYFAERCAANEIQQADFIAAKAFLCKTLPESDTQQFADWSFADWRRVLSEDDEAGIDESNIKTFAEHCDVVMGSNWNSFIIDEISKWCSSYYDQGQSVWGFPYGGKSLWQAFREVAQADLNPEVMGLTGFREVLKELPEAAEVVIEQALQRLQVPFAMAEEFLLRELMTVAGWSSYVQHEVHKSKLAGHENPSLKELLAIRLAYDVGLKLKYAGTEEVVGGWEKVVCNPFKSGRSRRFELARLMGHQAVEAAYQRNLLGQILHQTPRETATRPRPAVQAVFCIDVRSEVLRRHLESQDKGIETIGFAGFFGLPVEHLQPGDATGKAQCPVLLAPKYRAWEMDLGKKWRQSRQAQVFQRAWDSFRLSAVSCFGYVETCGLGSVLALAKDSLGLPSKNGGSITGRLQLTRRDSHCCTGTEIETAEQITVAANMLKNMGLRANFARLVLIYGHGSQTKNNPYGSALDCGACGGQAGDVNARLAAQLLNRTEVRAGLADHGFQIPMDTVFVAGLHNTTTDEVSLFDLTSLPLSHQKDVEKLQLFLEQAGNAASREREQVLRGRSADRGQSSVKERACDWSQVRPEWGLAGNAAFIAAPRELTQGATLNGRVFLHNYECEADKDDSVLELILTAPVVVASWINLQYYASRIDNAKFGSGNKAIHNVVGTLGVWQGNAGDLQAGLPLQSLHNGEKWMHEPLRLSVFIRAREEAINKVLGKHPAVEQLFANGWLHLFAIQPASNEVKSYLGHAKWTPGPVRNFPHKDGIFQMATTDMCV